MAVCCFCAKRTVVWVCALTLPWRWTTRRRASLLHDGLSLLRQRVYGLALGYEDLNDHETLRRDLAIQTAVERTKALASSSTLCRRENRADRDAAWRMHEVMVEQFIASFKRPPRKLVLDFDATDDAVHGKQEGRFFHGYYDHYCFLPLYVFCGDQLLVSYLRPSKIDGAKHAWAILALLVRRTSCHAWWPNQFRLLLSSLAYILLEAIRRLALQGTEPANAYVGTLRLKLLKIGAAILKNTRRIRFLLSSACPYQQLFFHAAARLAAG